MAYPYPLQLHVLQFLCTPDEYESITKNKRFTKSPEYWAILPSYIYSYCPICQVRYQDPADTYHINGWGAKGLQDNLYASSLAHRYAGKRCSHFLGIHTFLNFNGQSPTEIAYFENSSGEVPYVTPQFFHDDLKSYCVLHALPVCRLISATFVPTYTIFLLTYFSENPKEILARRLTEQAKWSRVDPEFRPAILQPAGFADENSFQLALWAESGKLGWLDVSQSDLPLQIGLKSILPEMYKLIPGRRERFIWRRRP